MTYKTIEAVAEALSIALAERGRATEELATIAIAAYQQAVASEAVGKQYRCQFVDGTWSEWFEHKENFPPNHITETRDVFAAPPAPIPAGWKLMPLEPTPEMFDAGYGVADKVIAVWDAMLEAAPAPGAGE